MPYSLPDYNGGSIVNLMSSLATGMGAGSAYPPAAALPPEMVAERRTVVLLVIDGLGDNFLSRFPGSALYGRRRGRLTSVFPTTTASAISTYLSATAPCQHGVTGWHMYLRELGTVAAILPFRARAGGAALGLEPSDVQQLFGWAPLFDQLDRDSHVVTADYIRDSVYSVAGGGRARRHGYSSLEECFSITRELARAAAGPRYIYAYWPRLDGLAHQHGVDSDRVKLHFEEIDTAFAGFLTAMEGSDSLIVVCADHGLIDTGPKWAVDVADHPELAECLALPLCGEPRTAFCYVRPGRARQFEEYVQEHFAQVADLVPRDRLLAGGYFGSGVPHGQLQHRVGDYALLMKPPYIIRDRVLGETPFQPVGVHGGLTDDELFVPLCLAAP